MNKKFGESKKKGWFGIRFIPLEEADDDVLNEV